MEDTRGRWERAYLEALDFDTWGQVEEAVESYQRLQVASAAEYMENVLQLPMNRRDGIGKLAAVLKLRAQELQTSDRGIGLNGMKNLKGFMKEMIITDAKFPRNDVDTQAVLGVVPTDDFEQLQQGAYNAAPTQSGPGGAGLGAGGGGAGLADDLQQGGVAAGTLRGPPTNLARGDLTLTIFVEKWGFKDATEFAEPRVTVSVWDGKGQLLEAVQETPVAKSFLHQYVFFENTVYIQTPLNRLPTGAAIFLEFKHWKAKKQKKSCKAYCFMEMDEIKSGPVTLEVYKKPAVYSRARKPALLSVKPLFLHLDLAVEKH